MYQKWEDSGFFNPDNLTEAKDPFVLMMPPPNVTGILHLGHALENTLMDTMIRYQRMQGKKALLVPGTDHAAVATQARVESNLVKAGHENPREEFGREGLLEKIREYAEESKSTILKQVRKMGTSADWSRLAYTFDEERNAAVNEVFIKMFNEGLIYKGHRVVNWSVAGQSTCSDDELVYVERPGKLYTFKYSKDFPITIATTRPETKLGDNAVAVHPEHPEYAQYIGQTFTVDVGAAKPLELQVIADEGVDPNFGTGALGVTTAHSPIDYAMYEKQKAAGNDIGLIQVIGTDGKMTAAAGEAYAGLSVEEAREKFVGWLRDEGLMEKEEDTMQNVGTSDRFKDVVEPLPMTQWFVDVNKEIPGRGKSLKDLMREAVTTGHGGDADQKVTITPARFEKIYFGWIDNLRDWCISRQIWWGHRIPVWYRGDEVVASATQPEGEGWTQDEDTLDTWFSSGMWTFSTLGWPAPDNEMAQYHPTQWMQMGYEILFFWMARMILFSTYVHDEIPFKDVYIHGMLRAKDGQKFSKSLGNGIEPLDVIAQYGTDALRYSLMAGVTPGNDSRFYEEKVESAQRMVNKLWNIARYTLIQGGKAGELKPETIAEKWIVSRLHELTKDVTADIDGYAFSRAAERLREFTWNDLADWYVEASKSQQNPDLIASVLHVLIRLWHPLMPYVTEVLWAELRGGDESELAMVAQWPKADAIPYFEDATKEFGLITELVTAVRSIKPTYKIDPVTKVPVVVVAEDAQWELISANTEMILQLARLESLDRATEAPAQAATAALGSATVYVPLAGLIDIAAEKVRLEEERDQLAQYIARVEKKLSNEGFVANAPAEVVEGEKEKVAQAKQKQETITSQLATL